MVNALYLLDLNGKSPYFMVKAPYFMVGTPPFPVLKLLQVATRLQDFESQITAQLSNLQTDFARGLGTVFSGSKRFWAVSTCS